MFRRLRNRTPFHITDVENLFAAVRDGNRASALRFAARILDRGLNGPPDGVTKSTAVDHAFGEEEKTKADELCDKLERMVSNNTMATDTATLASRTPATAADSKDRHTIADAKEDKGKAKTGTGKAGKDETGKDFSKLDEKHQQAADDAAESRDPQAPRTTTPANLSAETGAAAISWDALSQVILLVIHLIRGWQQSGT